MRIIIYGGNGFVGTQAAKTLILQGADVTCVSRTGDQPAQLLAQEWANRVTWVRGDADNPNTELLGAHQVLISTIGAPPIPTFTQQGYAKSLHTNGEVNARAIEAAGQVGIKRLVLLGAKLPAAINGDWFAYAKGKAMAMQAAEQFSQLSDAHSAVVIQPGGIVGRRHTKNGRALPIDVVLSPVSKLMPSQLISVDKVAQCIADAALGLRATQARFNVITHPRI